MFGFSDLLNDGRVIAVIGNYLFNGLVFGVLVEVIQLISIHSVNHVPDGCMFLRGGVAGIIGNDEVRSRGLTVNTER